jgi:signal transduction histidine kinase
VRHQLWSPGADLHRLVPCFAFAVAVVAAFNGPASVGNFVLLGLPVVFFLIWAYVPGVPLWALSIAVLVPVVAAQRSGSFEPLLFDLSLLAFVVGRWAPSAAAAVALGLLTVSGPIVASVIQDPAQIGVGPWVLGIVFPWLIGRAICSQAALAAQLDVTRRELAEQALYDERRRIARDVHDFVGHGLAAVMLQVTSARHVLRRDPDAAEEALLSAEEVGRRSMQELRRTVGLLRRDDEAAVAPPVPTATEIPNLVEHARAGGLTVELWTRGDLERVGPSVGTALYRISQEALANAARHAPQARTVLGIEVANGEASLVADSSGPVVVAAPSEERPRYGLVGMQERASALGGELTAGPTPEGWSVRCRLPLERADAR